MAKKSEGLIALSGGIHGDLARAIKLERNDLIEGSINYWRKNFPKSFYIEITRTGRNFEEDFISAAIELSQKHNIPLVASNDVRFINEHDYQAHEVRVCINDGSYLKDQKRVSIYNKESILKDKRRNVGTFFRYSFCY